MARIAKTGLEYFPFDIDFFQDIRIRKLIKRQGGKAITVYALLLCLIYKNGYYMQWDNELPFIGAEMSGYDEAYISEVIKTCLSLGLFDKNLFDKEHVLTSKGIQVRYCIIQRLNKRMNTIEKYSLTDEPQCKPSTQNKPKPKQDNAPKPAEPKATAAPDAPDAPSAPAAPAPTADLPQKNMAWLNEFFADNNSENLNLLCKNFGLPPGDVKRLRTLADEVIAEWKLTHTDHRDYNDWSRHLIATMRVKNREAQRPQAANTPINENADTQPSDYTFHGGFGGVDT